MVIACNVASHSTHLRPQDAQTGWWLGGCLFIQFSVSAEPQPIEEEREPRAGEHTVL